MERPHPTIFRRDEIPDVLPKRKASFEERPVLFDAPAIVQWLERGARAYRAGNLTAGRAVADTLRLMGDTKRGYAALCTQPFEPMSGNLNGVVMRDMRDLVSGLLVEHRPGRGRLRPALRQRPAERRRQARDRGQLLAAPRGGSAGST